MPIWEDPGTLLAVAVGAGVLWAVLPLVRWLVGAVAVVAGGAWVLLWGVPEVGPTLWRAAEALGALLGPGWGRP